MTDRSQVKHPLWLPRPLRPTPRVLAQARSFTQRTFGPRLEEALALEGFLRFDEGAMLCQLAHGAPPGAILEIGSYRGKSTVFLARGMTGEHTLTAVDPHVDTEHLDGTSEPDPAADDVGPDAGWNAYHETLRCWGVDDRVESVRRFSYNLRPDWPHRLAMLWIDGHHGYEAVRRDIDDWVELVLPGGHLAFHDTHPHHTRTHGWGVRRAICETPVLQREFERVVELRNAWFFRRRPQVSVVRRKS